MKLHEITSAGELPNETDMVKLLLSKGEPVMLATTSDGSLVLRQIIELVDDPRQVFSKGAGIELAGMPYTSLRTRGEGFFSWNTKDKGEGHSSITLPIPRGSTSFRLTKLKVFNDRPAMYVFGHGRDIEKTKARAYSSSKVTEAKKVEGGIVYLKGGYFLQHERAYTTPQQQVWTLSCIMDEDEPIAEVSIIKHGVQPEDVIFKISPFTNAEVISLAYRPISEKQKLEAFYDWVEKNYTKVIRESKGPDRSAITMLGGGFYLEEDPQRESSVRTFGIKRLMQDDEVGEASITGTEGDAWRGLWIMKVDGEKSSARIGSASMLYNLKEFGAWVRKHLKHQLGEDLFADSRKARQAKSNLEKPIYMIRLNKDGQESGMKEAVTHHNTEEEAKALHDQLVKNNPRSKIAHHMYSYNGEETFKTKFVGGKVVPLKGGIAGEANIEDAVHDFIQMLDDEGSAAGIWMPYAQKEELYKLYRAKHKVKSTGVKTEDMEPDKAAAKIDKKIKSLEAAGWKLFAQEENGDYVDMVFTKAP